MFYIDFLYALFVAILLAAVLIGLLGWRRPASSSAPADILFLFVILFLLVWAGGIWIEPFGPAMWGGYWLPFVAVGVIALLLLAAAGSSGRHRVRRYDTSEVEPARVAEEEAGRAVAVAFGAFFWFLLLALTAAIAAHYVMAPYAPPAI